MKILYLELKRVLKSKLTWILLALALLISILLAWLPTTYCYSNYTDEAGNEVNLTGLASIAHEKERQADAAGIVTPERVQEAVETYQACLASYGVTESYDLPEGVYEREILPIVPLLHGVKEAFADPDTGMAPAIMEINPEQIDDYYSVCDARITSLMVMEQPDSPAAQRKAVEMYQNIKKPFEVYPGMNSTVLDYQNIMGFLVRIYPSLYPVWKSLAWCRQTVCRPFHQRGSVCALCCCAHSGGGQPVRLGMHSDICADDVLHCNPGGHEHRRTPVPFCHRRTAFRSGFRELYTISLRQMQDYCVIPGVIAGILNCAVGHFHDGAEGARYMALQHPARQRNEHSGKRPLRNYGLPVFESGGVVRLDAVCHDRSLHD